MVASDTKLLLTRFGGSSPADFDYQLTGFGHLGDVALEHHGSRSVLLNHARAVDFHRRREKFALVDGAVHLTVGILQKDWTRACLRVLRAAADLREGDLRPGAAGRQAQVNQLQRLLLRGVSETTVVHLIEAAAYGLEIAT